MKILMHLFALIYKFAAIFVNFCAFLADLFSALEFRTLSGSLEDPAEMRPPFKRKFRNFNRCL
jgi:hypothetical protein